MFKGALVGRLSMPLPEVTVDPDMIQVAGGVNSKAGSFSLQMSSPKTLPIRHQQKVALYMKTAITWFCPRTPRRWNATDSSSVSRVLSFFPNLWMSSPRGHWKTQGDTIGYTQHIELHGMEKPFENPSQDAPEDHSCRLPRLLIPEEFGITCSNYTDGWWKPVCFFWS